MSNGAVTFLLHYRKEQTQGTFMSTSYTWNNKKYTFQGEAGQENQTLCGQLSIFSNFIL